MTINSIDVARYAYNGSGQLVGTTLPQPEVFMTLYDPADLDDYDRMDNFGRVTQSKWTKDLATDRDFYHTTVTWDRGSNVTVIEDNVHTGRDVAYTNDSLGRLTKAEEGTWGGSSISSRTREQDWTLDQVGNWSNPKLDLDGDNNWNETNEYNDTRTHDVVNQLTARNTDSAGGDEFTLTYNGVGDLTDDGEAYEYVYDAWGRLCTVKNTSNQATIASYRYNALGQRIMFHEDTEPDGDVDANDPKYYLIYDERWRHIATYRADDDNPKELFVSHQAGLDGQGGSSYIDSVILRQRDANSGWTSAADGTMEERRYYCQNWRADVSAIITSGGLIVEWAKYSSYGIPFGLPGGDTDSDGDCDATDITQIQTWIDAPAYDVRGDINLDGSVNATDKSLAISNYQGTTSGWNVLSAAVVANRIGYAGYQKDINLDISHVRHRVLEPHLGRWTRRDPLGYIGFITLYDYCFSDPVTYTDPHGEMPWSCIGCMACLDAVAASCTILCTNDYWGTPGEGFWSCFFKCVEATPEAAPLLTEACAGVCGSCMFKVKFRNKPPKTTPKPRQTPRKSTSPKKPPFKAPAKCEGLQFAKNIACAGFNGPRDLCDEATDCPSASAALAALLGCISALEALITAGCYPPGQIPDHQKSLQHFRGRLGNCIERVSILCNENMLR